MNETWKRWSLFYMLFFISLVTPLRNLYSSSFILTIYSYTCETLHAGTAEMWEMQFRNQRWLKPLFFFVAGRSIWCTPASRITVVWTARPVKLWHCQEHPEKKKMGAFTPVDLRWLQVHSLQMFPVRNRPWFPWSHPGSLFKSLGKPPWCHHAGKIIFQISLKNHDLSLCVSCLRSPGCCSPV